MGYPNPLLGAVWGVSPQSRIVQQEISDDNLKKYDLRPPEAEKAGKDWRRIGEGLEKGSAKWVSLES